MPGGSLTPSISAKLEREGRCDLESLGGDGPGAQDMGWGVLDPGAGQDGAAVQLAGTGRNNSLLKHVCCTFWAREQGRWAEEGPMALAEAWELGILGFIPGIMVLGESLLVSASLSFPTCNMAYQVNLVLVKHPVML